MGGAKPENHRIAELGSVLWRSSGPSTLLKQGHLEQVVQDLVGRANIEYFKNGNAEGAKYKARGLSILHDVYTGTGPGQEQLTDTLIGHTSPALLFLLLVLCNLPPLQTLPFPKSIIAQVPKKPQSKFSLACNRHSGKATDWQILSTNTLSRANTEYFKKC